MVNLLENSADPADLDPYKWEPYQAWVKAGINGYAVYGRIPKQGGRAAHWAFCFYERGGVGSGIVEPPSTKSLFVRR